MVTLSSALFAGNDLLRQIANDENGERISSERNRHDPAVLLVQQALLVWDPDCLPRFGADGDYGSETAGAVERFKNEVVHASPPVFNDVGPLTVQHLDAIMFAHEQSLALAARIAELDAWLSPGLSGLFSSVSSSDVVVHASGTDAFAALHAALGRCVDERALVVLSGWDFFDATPVAPGVTIGQALRDAATRGTRVRAMFNHFPVVHLPIIGAIHMMPGNNAGPVAFINGLPNGAAIHDARTLHHTSAELGLPVDIGAVQVGAHHQKAWVVWTGEELIAWIGGNDLNPNRTGPQAFHDVQAELRGGAAADVYNVLRRRWEDHPDRPAGVILPLLGPTAVTGTHRARVLTTFGNPTQFAGLNGPPYSFAPAGSKSYREMLVHLIRKAQRFIYVEDQYFVDESIAVELAGALPHLSALIIVICDSNAVNGELHQVFARRRAAFDHFLPHLAKVAVTTRNNRFVHSKTWVFDDTITLTGSANINRRGFEHDSEIGVAFGDITGAGTSREIRERLWNLHLGSSAPAPGTDPVTTLPLWQAPPAGAPVTRYDWAVGNDAVPVPAPWSTLVSRDQFWEVIDPRCP